MQECCNSCCQNCYKCHPKKVNKRNKYFLIICTIICFIFSIGCLIALIFIIKNNSSNKDKKEIIIYNKNRILDNKTYSIKENNTF